MRRAASSYFSCDISSCFSQGRPQVISVIFHTSPRGVRADADREERTCHTVNADKRQGSTRADQTVRSK
eukprot:1185642-Prorocentrum_minimum.AAC.3